MQTEELFTPDPKQVIGADCTLLGRVYVDALLQAQYVPCPCGLAFAVNHKVKARIAERASCGS